ncbi:hypothetical protein ES319_A11G346800v1 [Gossypium barbadense]|uniref:Uncharacterized protein n=1 Tax=Gossypium barbadense TaxID=3634 RepID=A0A5J5TWL8_GOSBA|nr:hypothetical protein ES319_A11G346800v1 [Gossypium barbadense]
MADAIAFNLSTELITKLSSHAFSQIGLRWNLKHDIDDLKRTVYTIKDVLLDAVEKSVTDELLKFWVEEVIDALYDADDLLDDFSTEALRKDLMSGNKLTKEVRLFFSSSNQSAYSLKMGRKIKATKARLASIGSKPQMFSLVKRDYHVKTSFLTKKRQQMPHFVREYDIIGRDYDKVALLKLLLGFQSEENLYIIPIVGMGGIGKTTLARLLYNDEMVRRHFELMMWVCVSDVFDVKAIVKAIIKCVTYKALDQNLEMDQLQKQLQDKIDGKKYLLVLDDIWNEDVEQWLSLKTLLMGGARGSKIILTTRSMKVAKFTSNCLPYVLEGLSDDDAWSLFKKMALMERYANPTNSAFVEIGKHILKKCAGVPLAIKTIGGMLCLKGSVREWHYFEHEQLSRISQREGGILPSLKLSYDYLPYHLKLCFVYCRLYPKDIVIDVQTLVQFWIAQGFVKQSHPSQSLDEIGFGYFKELVERSFFQEVEGRYTGEGLTCKMHDLMHDLAEFVAGTKSIVVDSNFRAREVGENYRHISVNPSLIPLFKGKKLRTLLHFPNKSEQSQHMSDETWDSIISNCRYLRVLKLDNLDINKVPCSIQNLKHLRYLDLSNNHNLKILPKSICKVQNLQALKLDWCSQLKKLPKKIEKLVNLTHITCERCHSLTHMPRGIGMLTSLQTLSAFVVDKDGSHGGADLSELSGLNNLRGQLSIKNLGFVKNAKEMFKAANLKEKQHLRSLVLVWSGDSDDDDKSLEDLQPHPNLESLLVIGWRGDAKFPSWISLLTNLVNISIWGPSKFKHLPSFAQLPCLQHLFILDLIELEYMDSNNHNGRQGDLESYFPLLKRLHIQNCPNMKGWWRKRPIDDDNEDDTTVIGTSTMAFPCLSYLHIEDCPLTSMPLYPSLDELILVKTSSRPLKQTLKMNITSISRSTSTPSLPLSKLNSFRGENIKELDTRMLDEWLQHLTNLRRLYLIHLPNLTSLPDEMRSLTSLEELCIQQTPQLGERCRKDIGVDWHKIAHIATKHSIYYKKQR